MWWAPRAGSIAVATLLAAACTPISGPAEGRSPSVPIVTPTDVDRPFPYEHAVQRQTFEAFMDCAAAHGVEYEGPFTDSTGDAFYTRLAPGTHVSRAKQEAVGEACPQMDVGIFATRIGPFHERRFEAAARAFVTCLRDHGFPSYPSPRFTADGDVFAAFWELPFEWSDARFLAAVGSCVDPLHDYVFAPEAT
jgi:hypothetical protein